MDWPSKLDPHWQARSRLEWPEHQATIERGVAHHADQAARHPVLRRLDREDLAQELRLAIWRELRRFDPQRASLATFVDRVAQSTLASLIRYETAQCRDVRRQGPSLDFSDENRPQPRRPLSAAELPDQCRSYSPDRELVRTLGNQDRQEGVAEFVANLNPPLRDIAQLLGRHSEHKVGQLLGLTRRQLRAHVERIRRLYEDRRLWGER